MSKPDKVLALNNAIGLLAVAAMDPAQPDVEPLIADFRLCLNDYNAWAENFWSGWALDIERGLEPILAEDHGVATFGEPIDGQRCRITFFPNVSSEHVKTLYASYQREIDELETWLRQEWATEFQELWAGFSDAAFTERYGVLQQADWQGFDNALHGLWDDVKQVFTLIADLQGNREKLLEYLTAAELETLFGASPEAIANLLLLLSDEPLMFIHLAAFATWLRLLPPQYVAEVVAQVRTPVLIGFLLARLTGPAGLNVGISPRVLATIKSEQARRWLAAASSRLAGLGTQSNLARHAGALKPLMVGARPAQLKAAPAAALQITTAEAAVTQVSDPLALARTRSVAWTRLSRQEHRDDAPSPAKNPNGDNVDSADQTATNGCPVSMVTGEGLQTLSDGALDGLLPFEFIRVYRTSAVETDSGLGFGWSHSLSHRLEIEGDTVIWIDHENRRTRFPLATSARPAVHNSLARAAIYLGDEPEELVISQAGETTRFYHFRAGHLTAISDAYGNRLTVQRDRSDRIMRLDNGAGRALCLRYERRHLATVEYQSYQAAATPEDAWRTEQTLVFYRYDACHRLIEATNSAGESERYDYDDQHVILQRQLAGGASFFWEWERSGKAVRCVRHWASFMQMDTNYVWDDNGGVQVKSVDGSKTLYQHDEQARLIRRLEPNGAEHLKAYDDKGRLVAEKNPLGATTRYIYDENGRLKALIPPEGEPTSYEHRNGFLHSKCRGKAQWTYLRNAQGDVIEATDPDGQVTRHYFDDKGRLLSTCYPDNSRHVYVRNDQGQLTEETLPNGSQRIFSYDVRGRCTTRQDEHGVITHYTWDAVGRLLQKTSATGTSRAFRYNAYGKVIAERNELGRVTRYEYLDDLHLVSLRINPDGSQVRYRFDNARLLLTEIENESGEKYRLDHTSGGLIRQEIAFDGRRTKYAYDLNGHLMEKTEFGDDDSKLITAYQRDSIGRLLVKTLPDGAKVQYRYDSVGRLVSVDDGQDHPLEFEYDPQDRLVTEHQGWGTLRYGYDACGQLNQLRLPDGSKLDYHHARGGTLTAIDLNGVRLTTHTFFAGHEQTRRQGLLLSEYQFDDQGRLKTHAVMQQQLLYRRDYAYTATGNLERVSDTRHGQRSYDYDTLDRLIGVRHARDQQPERFGHDPAGNLMMYDRPGVPKIKGNRLLVQGDRHYDYDAFGNLIRERRGAGQKLVTEYRYDCQHRLIGATLANGSQATYRYDAFGRRISKTVDGKTTEFFWQGDHLVAESGREHYRSYIYEPGSFRPLVLLNGKGPGKTCPFYYQLDHLGTPQELTDYGGDIIWAARYTAYGRLTRLTRDTHEVLDQPLRFQGQYFDAETGLHYNRHRYYQPDTGRYLTPDPSRLAGGLNQYRYTRSPTGWVDPLGLNGCPGRRRCSTTPEAEDPTEGVSVVDAEVMLPLYPEEKYLYRGDPRDPDEIFQTGFKPRGTSNDLLLHSNDSSNPPSNFVSTTPDREVGIDFATRFRMRKGFLYTLRPIPGRDLVKELGKRYKFSSEREVAIQGGVKKEDILGVTSIEANGQATGTTILNPNRK